MLVVRNKIIRLVFLVTAFLAVLTVSNSAVNSQPLINKYLKDISLSQIVPGADALGPMLENIPVLPATRQGKIIGYVFLTSDFVTTTGYSGKPIHVVAGVDLDARITGVNLVKHSEPIVLIGIPNSKIKKVTEGYAGIDLIKESQASGSSHDLDIVSGATVTIMVIDDSIIRAGLKVARVLGLGGLRKEVSNSGPVKVVNTDNEPEEKDWLILTGDGSVRMLLLDVGQVNTAFEKAADKRAAKKTGKRGWQRYIY